LRRNELEQELDKPPRSHAFASELGLNTSTPLRRSPIYFPNLSLQLLPLPHDKMEEIKTTGWTREVAFKTSPSTTKLEIKAYVEAVYGMTVERVSTINYLGRKYQVTVNKRGPNRQPMITMRDEDWKKAYVIFAPPPGVELPEPQVVEDLSPGLLERLQKLTRPRGVKDGPGGKPKKRQALLCAGSSTIKGGHPVLVPILARNREESKVQSSAKTS